MDQVKQVQHARLDEIELTKHRAHGAAASTKVVECVAPLVNGAIARHGEVIRAYEHSPEYQLLAKATQHNYARALGHELVRLYYDVPCGEIRPKHIKALRDNVAKAGAARLAAQGRAPRLTTGMANQVLSALRQVFRWGIVSCDLPHDPTANIPFFAVQKGHSPWSDAEVAAFMAAAPEAYRRAIALGLWTAQRVGDLVALRWDQWDGPAITLTPRKTRRRTRQALRIPLPPEANAALAEWKRDSTTLTILATGGGNPWRDAKRLASNLYDIRQTHGLADRSMHGLRATAASRLIEAGVPTRDVMALTGHTDERAFAAYVRKADQVVRGERASAAWAAVSPLRGITL